MENEQSEFAHKAGKANSLIKRPRIDRERMLSGGWLATRAGVSSSYYTSFLEEVNTDVDYR